MRIQESLVTDKQIALELHSENGKYRLPIEGKDYYFPSLEKVHEAFLNQSTYDTIKLTHDGKKSYLHLFMDEIEVFDTKKALRQRLSQDSQGMWAEIRNGQTHYYVEERGRMSTSYKEITEKECIEKLQHTSTMTKALGIGLGILALLPGAFEFARHLPIGTKEAAIGLIALNQKSPVLGAVGYSLLPKQVGAQAVGTEFQVNTYTTDDQSTPSVAPLNDGGFVVTWKSYNQDGDDYGIFGQRYDSSGIAAGSEFQVNTYTTSTQRNSNIAPLNDGGFVVTWESFGQDGDFYGIYGQRYDSNGVPAGSEFQINTYTSNYQFHPDVAPLNDGGFVVTWESFGQDGDGYGIFGQRYDSNGMVSGTEFQINTYTTSSQSIPSIAPLNDGGFVVTWESAGQDGSAYGIYGQRFDSSGLANGREFQVNSYTTGDQGYPSVAPLNDGGFIVTWESFGQDGNGNGIYGQRYTSSGAAVGTEFQINTYTTSEQFNPSVAPLNDGSFVVSWGSNGQDGDAYGIYGQRFDSSGIQVGAEFQVNNYTASYQYSPAVAALDDGGFVIIWESNSQDGAIYGIFGQRYDAGGNPIPLQLPIPTILTPSPSPIQGSSSQNTPTPSFVTTQSAATRSTPRISNTPSATPPIPTSTAASSIVVSTTPNQTPDGSTAVPSNTPTPILVTTGGMLGSTTVSSTGSTSNTLATINTGLTLASSTTTSSNAPSPTRSGSTPTSSFVSSSATSSSNQVAVSTSSSRSATSTSAAAMPTTSSSTIVSTDNIVYGQSYPIFVNDEVVGSYTVSGGTGLLDSENLNVISFDFDPSFQPEEGEVITLFYISDEDIAVWESIEIQGESIECLEPHGNIETKLEGASYQIIFEEATCLNMAPTILATALPLTLNS